MLFKSTSSKSLFAQSATGAQTTAPEINLIPFIDVLLVILIFLMISTTFTRYQELSITLPNAEGVISKVQTKDISVAITSDSRIAVNGKRVKNDELTRVLSGLNPNFDNKDASDSSQPNNTNEKTPTLTIAADGKASHQSVMLVMEAARNAGLPQVVFATQSTSK
jgi:biopolymer transport protein ExbD